MRMAYPIIIIVQLGFSAVWNNRGNDMYNLRMSEKKLFEDTSHFDKSLPVCNVKPCVRKLLEAVVVSNKQYYDSNKFFYSLFYKKVKGTRYLRISTDQWNDSQSLDYIGVLKLSDAIFLCKGDIIGDSLFSITNLKFVRIKLKSAKDSIKVHFSIEPSLQGGYKECTGKLINLEVYTKGQIRGFDMKPVRPSKNE
jgi:hypothetical protein